MSTWVAPELTALSQRLAPYARDSLERAAALAARLHAEEISPEHWLVALLEDESCAATRAVLHAFADPETIGTEMLALCTGIMVVGSGRTLPFSVLGVSALRSARVKARARGASEIEPADLLLAAVAELAPELRDRLALLAGIRLEHAIVAPSATGTTPLDDTGPLFRNYSPDALRTLAASCRVAASLERTSIGPVHLCLGSLDADRALGERTGLSSVRLRMVVSGVDADETPLPRRVLPGDERLPELLRELPSGAETLDVLSWCMAHGREEVTALLRRQKITPAVVERCRGTYRDPPLPNPLPPGSSPPGLRRCPS